MIPVLQSFDDGAVIGRAPIPRRGSQDSITAETTFCTEHYKLLSPGGTCFAYCDAWRLHHERSAASTSI